MISVFDVFVRSCQYLSLFTCNNYDVLLKHTNGNEDLSEEQNLSIFMAVHNCITQSKRFNLA